MKSPVADLVSGDVVRRMAAYAGPGPVVTCYLDVDGRRYVRPHDYELEFERMARPFHDRGNRALKRIEDYVRGGFDRSHTRGQLAYPGSRRPRRLPAPTNMPTVSPHCG